MKKFLLVPIACVLLFGCNNMNTTTSNGGQTEETLEDWTITTKVKAEILASTHISASARLVSVSTNDGVVTLTGNVPTMDDSDRIVAIAESVNGVVSVNNQMNVTNR